MFVPQDFCFNIAAVGDLSLQHAHYRFWLPLAVKLGKKQYSALFIRAIEEFEMASSSMKKLIELENLAATMSGALEPIDLVGEHIVCESSVVENGGGQLTAEQKKQWGLTAESRRAVKEATAVLVTGMEKDGSARTRAKASEGVGIAKAPTINWIIGEIVNPSLLFSQFGRRGTGSPVLPLSSRQHRPMDKALVTRVRLATATDTPWPHHLKFTDFSAEAARADDSVSWQPDDGDVVMGGGAGAAATDGGADLGQLGTTKHASVAAGADAGADHMDCAPSGVIQQLKIDKPAYEAWLPETLGDAFLLKSKMSISEAKASGEIKQLAGFLKGELRYRNEQMALGRMPAIAGRLPSSVVSTRGMLILGRNNNDLAASISEHNQLLRMDRQKLIDDLPTAAAASAVGREHRSREAQPKTTQPVSKKMWLPPKGALLVSIGEVILPPRCDGGHSDSGAVSLLELVVHLQTTNKLSVADAQAARKHLLGDDVHLGWYVANEPGFNSTVDAQESLRSSQRRKAAYLEKQAAVTEKMGNVGTMEDAILRGVVGSAGDYATAELAGLAQVLTGSGRSNQVAMSMHPVAAKTYLIFQVRVLAHA
jgi:hypothetical protein